MSVTDALDDTIEAGDFRFATTAAVSLPLSEEDQARADLYALIARLFLAAPDALLLNALAAADTLVAQQADSPLEAAWERLVLTAGMIGADTVSDEFDALFISTGTPRINPYASLYLSGFMNDRPLVGLRAELAQLGLARVRGRGETEDHLSALCEAMRVLITGAPGVRQQPLARQKLFFATYIAPWHVRCMDDIRAVEGVQFYRHVADVAQAFFSIETQAFDMVETRTHGEGGTAYGQAT